MIMALETLFWISIITAGAVGLGIVVITYLVIKEVVDWFRSKSRLKQADKKNIAFTLVDKIRKGEYKTVQGIFNTRKNKVEEGRVIKSEAVDSEIENLHRDNELVIYE